MLKNLYKRKINEKWFCKAFCSFATVVFALLLYFCLGGRGIHYDEAVDEYIYFQKDSILFNLLLLVAASAILYFYGKLDRFFMTKKRRNILAVFACFFAVLFGIFWVKTTCTYPQGDQEYVLIYARLFNSGDFSALEDGGYLSIYPQQLGIVTLLRIIRVFFQNREYAAFQYLTALMLPAIIIPGVKAVRYFSADNVRAELFYILFVLTCFPMYAYTPFVYGDLCSLEMGMLAVWAFISCLERFKGWKLVWLGISVGLAVLLRQNIIILAIAMGIVVILKLIFYPEGRRFLAMGFAMAFGIIMFQGVIGLAYHNVRDNEADAIPASAFIVMGLNDDYEHSGWYNWYGYNLFYECGMDAEETTKHAMADLKSYMALYRNDPSYMVDFFTRKMFAQWNAPMYQCIAMNSRIIAEQGAIAKNIYGHGILFKLVNEYMKVFQLVLYGAILFMLIVKYREWDSIDKYILLIAVIGGFLFSLLWEAKTRYVFPYLLMQLPYMAIGVNEALKNIKDHLTKTEHIV